jgi:ubiquinone/menaquinone biosynthesis C-methylase UbiE
VRNPLFSALYDRVLAPAEDAGLRDWRGELLADTGGAVLEVGAGTGLNVPHYPATVDRLVLTDPDPGMTSRLRSRVQAHAGADRSGDVEVLEAGAERLPFPDDTFDEVVTTLVFCSLPSRLEAGAEIARVLRPGGLLRFIEHVAATPHGPSTLQRVVQPVQRLVAGGCRLDLSMGATLRATGFEVERIEDRELPGMVPWTRPAVFGTARAGG